MSSPLGAVALISGLCLIQGCKPETKQEASPPVVRVDTPRIGDVPIWKAWIGTLTGVVNASILPQVSGYVESQNYENGSLVKKGDLLFMIDQTIYKDQVDQASARLAEAQSQWKQADFDKRVYGPLVAENALSKQKYEEAVISTETAQAGILAAEAALNLARRNLDFTRIVAPIDGVAGLAAVQVGDFVSPSGQVMTEVSTIDPIRLDFSITEREWLEQTGNTKQGAIAMGDELTVILSNGTEYPHKAKVTAIGMAFDSQTGTMGIQAQLDNKDLLLRPGMFVRVKAVIGMEKDALIVPQKAIYTTQGKFFVISIATDNMPNMVPVNVGATQGTDQVVIPIEKGSLTKDTRIVVEGLQAAMMAASRGGIPVEVAPKDVSAPQKR